MSPSTRPRRLSDLDYIRSAASPSDDTFVTELTGIVNPGSGTVTMRVRRGRVVADLTLRVNA